MYKLSIDCIKRAINHIINHRLYAWYEINKDIPVTSAGFPLTITSAGLGLNLELGLNFQVIKQLNIGYRIIPVAGRLFWEETHLDDPRFPPSNRSVQKIKGDGDLFQSIIGLRNFHISYCF
jgi:hypothetical protein